MKRMRKQITKIVTAALLALLLFSCGPNRPTPSSNPTTTAPATVQPTVSGDTQEPEDTQSAVTASEVPVATITAGIEESPLPTPETSPSPATYKFYEKTYAKGGILVKYPQMTGYSDPAAEQALNQLIADRALSDVDTLGSNTEYMVDYRVTYSTPQILSMYFSGYINVSGAAHPGLFLKALTLDIDNRQEIPLSSLVTVNTEFVTALLNGDYTSLSFDMTADYAKDIKAYLESLGLEYWETALNSISADSTEAAFYLTEDDLVISLAVPYAMGSHVELHVEYNDVQQWQTDSALWTYIT